MQGTQTEKIRTHFDKFAKQRDYWRTKNHFYHHEIEQLCRFIIPPKKKVLDIGCNTGDFLYNLRPSYGVGIDISYESIKIAQKKYPKLKFVTSDCQNLNLQETFDYVVLSDLIGYLEDLQKGFEELHKVADERTRIIITSYNYLWEPIIVLSEKLGLRMRQPIQNWLSGRDIENLLELSNFDVVKKSTAILLPIFIPLISNFVNRYIARLPIFKQLCLVQYFVVRQKPNHYSGKEYSVSIIIPARNEQGNIEKLVIKIPKLGTRTQLIFIEGHSRDNTKERIQRIIRKYKDKKEIILVDQGKGIGKADAVRKGIAKSDCDVIIIFDADLTVPPEDLDKFYHSLRLRKGEYVQGSRLVYSMEKQAMRLLNVLGNKFFSLAFTWLLDQPIKDTLCGTKAIFKKDYAEIAKNRSYFGNFDPFGDFDLTFGASKLGLKIIEIPIRYHARTYGASNISRFVHGWLLLKMTFIAAKKLKFF